MDFLTKKKKKNNGEIPQYYVENSHPAIVTPEVYDLVQAEIQKRKATGRAQSGLHPFSSRIICGRCGQFFGPKTWHSTGKYKRTVWRCNHKYKSGDICQTPHLYEAAIQKAFVDAFNRLYSDRERLMEDYAVILTVLTDTEALDKEAAEQQTERDVTMEPIRKCVEENTRSASDQEEYRRRYETLAARYEDAGKRLCEITEKKRSRAAKREGISRFMDDIAKRGGPLTGFDEAIWRQTVDTVTVRSEKDVAVAFRDGSVVHVDSRLK